MKQKVIQYSTALLGLVLVAGCTKQVTVMKQAAYDSVDVESAARIRMFGQNGLGVFFNENSACVNRATRTAVSGDMSSTFSSFVGRTQNESLGMTETDRSRNVSDRNGALSQAYYREYYFNSGEPVVISGAVNSLGTRVDGVRVYQTYKSCGLLSATFIPEAGKQYEARVDSINRGNACRLSVSEILEDGAVRPLPVSEAPMC